MNGKVLGIPLAFILLVVCILVPVFLMFINTNQKVDATNKTLQYIQQTIIDASTPKVEVVPEATVSMLPEVSPTATPKAKVVKQVEGAVSSTTTTAQ